MIDIWILVQNRETSIEAQTFGLTAEARRLVSELGDKGRVTAIALGDVDASELAALGKYGVDRVLNLVDGQMIRYQGEYASTALFDVMVAENPTCLLGAQTALTEDLFPRMAALLGSALITRAMDFHMTTQGNAEAIRPLANGYLFEKIEIDCQAPPIVSFLPPVLFDTEPDSENPAQVEQIEPNLSEDRLKIRVSGIIEAAAQDLDLEEADIIVAGGRGAGKDEDFDVIHQLAKAINGTVGATRPIIDWGTLPYERQIGQTGKYVAPRLIINCGISGANEYTAGIEKSKKVIAIDMNPRARIFRFADLGVVGDVHDILPRLTARIEEKQNET